MKSIIKKEIEELSIAASVFVIGCLLASDFVDPKYQFAHGTWTSHSVLHLLNHGDLTYWTVALAPLIAFVFGFMQVFIERKSERWAFLVQRPISLRRIFAAKAIGGIGLSLAVVGIPFLYEQISRIIPGRFPYPYGPAYLVPGLIDLLNGAIWWMAGAIVGRRFNPFAPIAVLLATILSANVASIGAAILIDLIALAIITPAALGSFVSRGEIDRQTIASRFGLTAFTILGIAFITTICLALLMVIGYNYNFPNRRDINTRTSRDIDYWSSYKDLFLSPNPNFETDLHPTSFEESYRQAFANTPTLDSAHGITYYFDPIARDYKGYVATAPKRADQGRKLIGTLDGAGFHKTGVPYIAQINQPPSPFLVFDNRLVSEKSVAKIDINNQTVAPIFNAARDEEIIYANAQDGFTTVVSNRRMIDIAPDAHKIYESQPIKLQKNRDVEAVLISVFFPLFAVTAYGFQLESELLLLLAINQSSNILNLQIWITFLTISLTVMIGFGVRARWTRLRIALWCVLSLIFGLFAPLAALILYKFPRLEACSSCGRKNRITQPRCSHCGAQWPIPASRGNEIFIGDEAEYSLKSVSKDRSTKPKKTVESIAPVANLHCSTKASSLFASLTRKEIKLIILPFWIGLAVSAIMAFLYASKISLDWPHQLSWTEDVATPIAGGIAFFQFSRERSKDAWSYMFQRPVSPTKQFLAKLLVGVCAYLLAVEIPYCAELIYFSIPGCQLGPIFPKFIEANIHDVLFGMIAWLVVACSLSMAVNNRISKFWNVVFWILNLIAAYIIVTTVRTAPNHLMSDIILWTSLLLFCLYAWGAFVKGGEIENISTVSKFGIGAITLIGFLPIIFNILTAIQITITGRLTSTTSLSFASQAPADNYDSYPAYMDYTDDWSRVFYDDRAHVFLKYSLAEKKLVSWMDGRGEHRNSSIKNIDPVWIEDLRYTNLYINLYCSRHDVRMPNLPVIFQASPGERILDAVSNAPSTPDKAWHIDVITDQRIVSINGSYSWREPDGHTSIYDSPDHSIAHPISWEIIAKAPGAFTQLSGHPVSRLTINADRYFRVRNAINLNIPAQQTWESDLAQRISVDSNPVFAINNATQAFSDLGAVVFMNSFAVDTILATVNSNGAPIDFSTRNSTNGFYHKEIDYLALTIASGVIGLLFTLILAKRLDWRRGLVIKWAIGSILLGLYTPLFILLFSQLPILETCPACGKKRTVSRDKCEHCGAEWPEAPRTGAEIFEATTLEAVNK